MKTNVLILIACLLLIMNSCNPFHTIIRGDGNLVTRTLTLDDYDVIEASHSMKITYVQSEDIPALTVTTDQNIMEKYIFQVNGTKLEIKPKDEYRRTTNFLPTQFTVTTHSKGLKKADLAGSITFDLDSLFTGNDLEINLAGSGTINLNDQVTVHDLKAGLAGSATFNAYRLKGNDFDGNIAGSGKLNLGGIMTKATFEIAGSGIVRAFDLQVEDLACNIAGSGDVEISVSNSISADIAGSGRIKHKGDPQIIRKEIAGSGSIKKMD
ncbi:MAG: DUF2807 domain-containing protein [Tannerellaceae bacterium]|jgi:hypothetical protein|nr:DUF2807 domain-containing protein [Tannerellaceae bacterium]